MGDQYDQNFCVRFSKNKIVIYILTLAKLPLSITNAFDQSDVSELEICFHRKGYIFCLAPVCIGCGTYISPHLWLSHGTSFTWILVVFSAGVFMKW